MVLMLFLFVWLPFEKCERLWNFELGGTLSVIHRAKKARYVGAGKILDSETRGTLEVLLKMFKRGTTLTSILANGQEIILAIFW